MNHFVLTATRRITVNTRNYYGSMCKSRCSSHNTAARTETSSTHVVDSTAGQKLCWHCTSAFLHVAHCFPPNIELLGPKHFSKLRHKNHHFATHFAVTYQSPGTAWLTAVTGWTASRSRGTSRSCWNRNFEASSWLCFEKFFLIKTKTLCFCAKLCGTNKKLRKPTERRIVTLRSSLDPYRHFHERI